MRKTYDVFVEYYDKIVRGNNSPLDEEVDYLERQIKSIKPKSSFILELACGTGVVGKELINRGYEVTGLDISKNMLVYAEKNMGKDNTILGDMTDFDLGKKFDIVLCNYNSMCHLIDFEDWKKTFKNVANHLDKGGLFIFDINTIGEFEDITRDFAQFYNFGEDTVCLEMFKRFEHDPDEYGKGEHYEWLIKMFKKTPKTNLPGASENSYELFEEVVRENSFELEQIKVELDIAGFQVVKLEDFHEGIEATEESERVYFICRKK